MAANRKEYELLMKLTAALDKSFNGSFQTAMNTTNSLRDKLVELKKQQSDISQYQKSETAIKSLREEKARLESETNRNEAAIDKVNKQLAKEEEKLSAVSERLKAAGVDTSNLAAENDRLEQRYNELTRAQENFSRASEAVKQNNQAISATRTELLKTTGVAAAAGAAMWKGFIEPAANFEEQMSVVRAISGATGEDMARLSDLAREMGATTQFTAIESGQALEYMAMAGWNTTAMMNGLPGIMHLAAASGEDLATVSDIVTDAMTAFGMTADESARFADVLAATATSANTNVGIMGETFKYVAPLAGAMGYSIEDMSVAIGMMANSGIKGSMAGTTLRNIITNLVTPTDSVAAAMEELGVAVVNADGTAKSFEEVVNSLRQGFDGLTEEQKAQYAATIGGQRGMSGLLAIVNSGEGDFAALTEAIADSTGAAEQMAATRLDNMSGDLTLAKSAWEGLRVEIGELFLPKLREATQGLTETIGKISSFISENKEMVVTITAVAGALLAAKIAFLAVKLIVLKVKGVILAVKLAMAAYKLVQVGATSATAVWGAVSAGAVGPTAALGAAMAAVSWPVLAIVAAVAAAIAIVVLMVKHWDKVKAAAGAVWEAVKNAFGKVVEFLAGVWDKIKAPFVAVWNWIKDNWKTIALFILNPFAGIFKVLYDKCEGFRNFINGVVEKIKAIFAAIVDWFKTYVIAPLLVVFSVVWKIVEIFAKIFEIIIVLFVVLAKWFYDNVIMPVVEFFKGLFEKIREIFTAIWDTITSIFSAVVGFFTGVFTAAWEGIKTILAPVGEFFAGVWNGITAIFSNVAAWFVEKFTAAWEGIKNVFSVVGAFFQGVWDSIVSIFTKVGTAVGNAIGDAFKFVVNTVIGFAEGFINTFIKAINAAIGLINKIPGVNIELITELNIPRLEKGSNYTPDTFVAGDVGGEGGELVTNARGYKVFDADETDRILENISKAKAINNTLPPVSESDTSTPTIAERLGGFIGALKSVAANRAEEMAQPPPPILQNGGGDFTYNDNTVINIDGNAPGDLEEKLKQHKENVILAIKELLRKQREDEGRMAYA